MCIYECVANKSYSKSSTITSAAAVKRLSTEGTAGRNHQHQQDKEQHHLCSQISTHGDVGVLPEGLVLGEGGALSSISMHSYSESATVGEDWCNGGQIVSIHLFNNPAIRTERFGKSLWKMAKIQDLKIEELKQELEKRNLATSGRKVELLSRLREAMEAEGIDLDKYDFQGKPDDTSAKDEQKDEAACSSMDVHQTSGRFEEQKKAPSSSTAMDMNTLLAAMSQMSSQISSQLQMQETRLSSQLEAQKTYMLNLFKDNAELRERQDKIEERQDKIEALIKEKQDKVEAKVDELEDRLRGLQLNRPANPKNALLHRRCIVRCIKRTCSGNLADYS
ncbi:PREDICTED: uncharacterized protein LOC108367031 isoform X2 [Rhagoletis zephyria]|uniref:uncharacterized protein LOC108367031 isoform X2 n=1 Tax=Rhagoletis zephyria TaxID=28612 RepID=UPI0008112BD9|nr:PREDICTED: uncharacterized protein LOC108367031 isoform X2 [Rhagoletis zephyria]